MRGMLRFPSGAEGAVNLTIELAKVDENLAASTVEASTFEKKRARLVKIIDEKRAELAPLPTIERELQLRQADVDVANTTYGTVAKELKDAEIRSDAMPEASVISPAFPPKLPSRPRCTLILLISVFIGLLVGVGLAFFLEYINRTVRGIHDIEDFVGLKVIGTIPRAPRTRSIGRELGYSPHSDLISMRR